MHLFFAMHPPPFTRANTHFFFYYGEFFCKQKSDSFLSPLIDQHAKEGKDKKVVFEARFSKPNAKPKWFCRKDVCIDTNENLLKIKLIRFD